MTRGLPLTVVWLGLSLAAIALADPPPTTPPIEPAAPPAATPAVTQPQAVAVAPPTTPAVSPRLDPDAWREYGVGLAVHPPRDARITPATSDGALVNFLVPDVGQISVNIHRPQERTNLDQVVKRAGEQLGYRFPSAVVVHESVARPAGRPGSLVAFKVPDPKAGDWVLAMMVITIDPYTYATIELTCTQANLARAMPLFMDVVASATLLSPKELERQRTVLLTAGQAVLDQLTPQRLTAWAEAEQQAAPTGRWYRVLQDGKDVGGQLVQIQLEGGERDKKLRFLIRSRTQVGPTSFDTVADYLETLDGDNETWSIVTTQRGGTTPGGGPIRPSNDPITRWAQTGVRGMLQVPVLRDGHWVAGKWSDAIKVTRDGGNHKPASDNGERLAAAQPEVNQWLTPETAYLSQVRAEALGSLLRGTQEVRTLGFYCYHSPTKRVALRFVRVQPLKEGNYLVLTRPDPERGVQSDYYNAQGELLRRELADGRVLIPSTAEQVETIWAVKK